MSEIKVGQVWVHPSVLDQPVTILEVMKDSVIIWDHWSSRKIQLYKSYLIGYCILSPGYQAAEQFDKDLEELLE